MPADWNLLFWVWLCGCGCGALCWYWVLKFFDRDKSTHHGNDKGQKPAPFLQVERENRVRGA